MIVAIKNLVTQSLTGQDSVTQNSEAKEKSTPDPTSLDSLHDLVMPSELPSWPPAIGWYFLLFGMSLLTGWILIKLTRIYLANAYRRAALLELSQIRQDMANTDQRARVFSQLNQLLKRVALARWKRDLVAKYSGQNWLDFLNQTGKDTLFSQTQIETLRDSAYSSRIREGISQQELAALIDKAETWIKSHQIKNDNQGGHGDRVKTEEASL